MSHLTKTETSLAIWLNVVTIVAQSVRLLPAYTREEVHATRQLHCQWWSGQRHAKHAENAASVHNTCLDKIVCYLQRIFNRNWKLKQQVRKKVKCTIKLGVCSQIKVCYVFVCIFFQICTTRTSNFHMVVRQHTKGMVGSIIYVLLKIYLVSSSERILKIR